MRLLLRDAVYTDRLAAFLRSVGQDPTVVADNAVEIADIEAPELDVYLRVWGVLHPDAEVTAQT